MAHTGSKTLALSCLFLVAGCGSTSGNWPNLSDPLPDASERERVIERANPSANTASPAPARGNPMTKSVAIKLLTAVKADVENANKAYLSAKAAINTATGEEKGIAWHEAQLLLTRLSHTTNKLDSIIYAKKLKNEGFWTRALTFKTQQDEYVAAERQRLSALKP